MRKWDEEQTDRIIIAKQDATSDQQIDEFEELAYSNAEQEKTFNQFRQSVFHISKKTNHCVSKPFIILLLMSAVFVSLRVLPPPSPQLAEFFLSSSSYQHPQNQNASWVDSLMGFSKNLQIYASQTEYASNAPQIERFLLKKIKGNEKIMVVYEQKLKTSIVLLATLYSHHQKVTKVPSPLISIIIKYSYFDTPSLNALILSLLHNRCLSKINFVFSKLSIEKLWRTADQYEYVIGGKDLWTSINGNLEDLEVDQIGQYAAKFVTKYPFTSFLIDFEAMPFNSQLRLGLLPNYIESLTITNDSQPNSYSAVPLDFTQLQNKQKISQSTLLIFSSDKKVLGRAIYEGAKLAFKLQENKQKMVIDEYDCFSPKYKPLQTMSPLPHYYYHQNPLDMSILVPANRLSQYSKYGCTEPGLLRFLLSLHVDRPLLISDAINDDMIYLGMAKTRRLTILYIIIMPSQKKNLLERQMKDSKVSGVVKYIEIQPSDTEKTKKIYDIIKPDLLLTSFHLFARDYTLLFEASLTSNQVLVVFLWDNSNPEFMLKLIQTHPVSMIVSLNKNVATSQNKCLEYELKLLKEVPKEEGWVAVRLGVLSNQPQ